LPEPRREFANLNKGIEVVGMTNQT